MSATGTERAPWLCRTCAWGFPESIGYSCSHLEGHICSHVVVACEEYRRRHDCSQEIPKKGQTMSTSDERREVAARLRTAAKTKSNSSDYLWRRLEIAVNGWRFGDAINDSYTFDNDVLARLADLIEPTTRTTTFTLDEHSKDGEEVYPTRWWKCARCGEETIMLYDEGEPVACPYCGAKVADDGVRGDAV